MVWNIRKRRLESQADQVSLAGSLHKIKRIFVPLSWVFDRKYNKLDKSCLTFKYMNHINQRAMPHGRSKSSLS